MLSYLPNVTQLTTKPGHLLQSLDPVPPFRTNTHGVNCSNLIPFAV